MNTVETQSMNQKVLQCLLDAKALIFDKKNWVQEAIATDKKGTHVSCNDKDAVCFCAIGAVIHTADDEEVCEKVATVLDCVAVKIGHRNIVMLNDNSTHSKVLQMFDKAIAKCEAGMPTT